MKFYKSLIFIFLIYYCRLLKPSLLIARCGLRTSQVALLFDPMINVGVNELVLRVDLDHLIALLSEAANGAKD